MTTAFASCVRGMQSHTSQRSGVTIYESEMNENCSFK